MANARRVNGIFVQHRYQYVHCLLCGREVRDVPLARVAHGRHHVREGRAREELDAGLISFRPYWETPWDRLAGTE